MRNEKMDGRLFGRGRGGGGPFWFLLKDTLLRRSFTEDFTAGE